MHTFHSHEICLPLTVPSWIIGFFLVCQYRSVYFYHTNALYLEIEPIAYDTGLSTSIFQRNIHGIKLYFQFYERQTKSS